MLEPLKFENILSDRPEPKGLDVICRPRHLAIITYTVEPERLEELVPKRFGLTTVKQGRHKLALLSAVSLINEDFTLAAYPSPKLRMAQVNYRVYVINRETGERCVWFLGTVIDSWMVSITRYLWRLPWHKGEIKFDFDIDKTTGRYRKYALTTKSAGFAADVEIFQEESARREIPGFPDRETALIYLSQPLCGYCRRRDGRLSSYRIWHPRMALRDGKIRNAYFEFLAKSGLVEVREQQRPHSVLIGPDSEFTIYLPPRVID